MKAIITLCIILIGCTQPDGLSVDTNCTDQEVQSIHSAVQKINEIDGVSIDVVSMRTADYNEGDKPNDGYDFIYCKHFESDTDVDQYGGLASTNDITIYSYKIDDEQFEKFVMHELGHYAGAGHVQGEENIMHWIIKKNGIIQYSDADILQIGGGE
jgi:hypothetical protein